MESIIEAAEQANLISLLNSHQKRRRQQQLQQKQPTEKYNVDTDLDIDLSGDDHMRLKQNLDPLRKALSEFDAAKFMNLKRYSDEDVREMKSTLNGNVKGDTIENVAPLDET